MDNELKFIVTLQDNATKQAKNISNSLNSLNRTFHSRINLSFVDNVTSKLNELFSIFGGESGFIRMFSADMSNVTNIITKVTRSISSIFNQDSSKDWYESVIGRLKDVEKWGRRLADTMVSIFTIGGAALTTAATAGAAILTKQIVSINKEMEQYEISLETTLGSLTAAKREMAEIVKFAKETPYQINQVTDAVVRLRAYGMDPDAWLKPLGDAAAAFGRDITDAIEMAASVRMGMPRRGLRYGIKFTEEMFKVGGKYVGQTREEALLKELERFSDGMEKQAKTLAGLIAKIKDVFYISFYEATKPIFNVIKKQVSDMLGFIESDSGQAKLKQIFAGVVSIVQRIINTIKSAVNYVKSNLIPVFKSAGESMLQVFGTVMDMARPIITALIPVVTALTQVLSLISWVMTRSKLLLQVFVAYSVATKVVNTLGFSLRKVGINAVASSREVSALGIRIKTIGTTVVAAAAAFASMWVIGNYLEVRNNLKEIGNEIYRVAKGAKEVKQYLKDMGKETGHNTKEMTEAALAAKQFGHNMANVLDVASKATSESTNENIHNLNVNITEATETIGRLAEAFIKEGDSLDVMADKTRRVGDMLVKLDNISEITGITFNDLAIAAENNRDVWAKFGDDIEGLTALIANFGARLMEVGIDASATKIMDVVGQLLAPTKEMLLSLPVDTWIIKPLKDMDVKGIYDLIGGSMNESSVKRAISNINNTMDEIELTSEAIKSNFEKGADYAYDKILAAGNKMDDILRGGGTQPGKPLGGFDSFKAGMYDNLGTVIASVTGIVVATALTTSVIRRIATRVGMVALGTAGKGGLASKILVSIEEKQLAKMLGRGFIKDIEKALPVILSDAADKLKAEKAALKEELAVLRKANKAMPTEEGILQASELSERLGKMPERQAAVLEELQTTYKGLIDAIKEGKVPAHMRALVTEVQNLTKEMKGATKGVTQLGKTTRSTARLAGEAATRTGAAPRTRVPVSGRILGTSFMSIFDKRGFEMSVAFLKGLSLRNVRKTFLGWARLLGDIIATESEKKARGRMYSLVIGPWSAKALSKGREFMSGGGAAAKKGVTKISKEMDPTGIRSIEGATGNLYRRMQADEAWTKRALKVRKELMAEYDAAANVFAKYTDIMPKPIQQQLTRMGAELTPEAEKILDKVLKTGLKIELTADEKAGWAVIRTAVPGIKDELKMLVPLRGAGALGTMGGLQTYLHELGHILAKSTKETGTIIADRLLPEGLAWAEGIKIAKALRIELKAFWRTLPAKIVGAMGSYLDGALLEIGTTSVKDAATFAKILTKYLPDLAKPPISAATIAERIGRPEELATAEGRAALIARIEEWQAGTRLTGEITNKLLDRIRHGIDSGRNALGEFMSGNVWRMTPMTEAEKTGEAFAKQLSKSTAKTGAGTFESATGQLQMFPAAEFRVADVKRLTPIKRLQTYVRNLREVSAATKATVETFTQLELFDTGALTKAKKIGKRAGSQAASKAVSALLIVSIANVIDDAVLEFTGKSIEQIPKVGGILKGTMQTVDGIVSTVFSPLDSLLGGLIDSFGSDKYARTWTERTGALGVTIDTIGNTLMLLPRFLDGLWQGIKGIPKSFKGGIELMNKGVYKLFTGKTLGGDPYALTEKTWGKEMAAAEKAADAEKDAAKREAAHQAIHEAKIAHYKETIDLKREAVLEVLNKRIEEQFTALEAIGKSPGLGIKAKELSRAAEFVEKQVDKSTDLFIQIDEEHVQIKPAAISKLIEQFEEISPLTATAYANVFEDTLAKYDFSTIEGFSMFVEDLDTGNLPEAFKQLYSGVDANNLIFSVGIEIMRDWQDEANALEEEVQKLELQIESLNEKLEEIEKTSKKLSIASDNIKNAFDLARAENNLALYSDRMIELRVETARFATQLAKAEYEMLPLQNALNKITKEFDDMQKAIDKTQDKLDKLLNAPIEGESEYKEAKFRLDRALAHKEKEIETLRKTTMIDEFSAVGLGSSDAYKRAAVRVEALEAEAAAIRREIANLDWDWEDKTAEFEFFKEQQAMRLRGEPIKIEEAMPLIEQLTTELLKQTEIRDMLQEQVEKQTELRDAKQNEIDAITYAMQLREAEMDVIEKQVEYENTMLNIVEDKMKLLEDIETLRANILPIEKELLGIEHMMSAQKLLQFSLDYAAGNVKQEQFDDIMRMSSSISKEMAKLTGQRFAIELEVEAAQARIPGLTEKSEILAADMKALADKLGLEIQDINANALTKADMAELFGGDVKDVLKSVAINVAAITNAVGVQQQSQMVDKYGNKLIFAGAAHALGGIVNNPTLSTLAEKGPEAVIPLQHGYVPVKITGGTGGGQSIVNNVSLEVGTITVRDDKDMEELKMAILDLRQGQYDFFSQAHHYPTRF